MPKVFIIILNWNGWPDTMECLDSLNMLNYDNFEVILIDNASKQKIRVVDARFPKLKITQIFNDLNSGFAGGNNVGIKIALEKGADYILLLNNDTIVEPDFLNNLVEAAVIDKKYGILGPVIYDYADHNKIQFAGGKINWSINKGTHLTVIPALTRNLIETDYITGCCLLIKKEVIEKIGLMDEDYFLYYEDTDWNMRVRNAGWFCGVVPEAKIYHKASQSSREFSYPYIYYHSRNGLIFASRFGSKILTYLISFWIFLKQLLKLIIGYRCEWARPVMKGVMDFWKGKRGKLEGYY